MFEIINTDLPKALPNMETVTRLCKTPKPRSSDFIKYVREPKVTDLVKRLQRMEKNYDYNTKIYFVEIRDDRNVIWYDQCYYECVMTLKEEFRYRSSTEKLARSVYMYQDGEHVETFTSGLEAAEWLQVNGYAQKSLTLETIRSSVYRACRMYEYLYLGFGFKYGEDGVK